jgi:hypothetical protein
MSSMTIKALLPSARYTCHDVTYSVLRNIRDLLANCIFKAVNGFFMGGIWKLKFLLTPSLILTALKMQFASRLRMLRRTLHVTSWQVYLADGSNALIVTEDISKTSYWRREAFCESKTMTNLTVCSLYLLLCTVNVLSYFQKLVTLNAAPCISLVLRWVKYFYICQNKFSIVTQSLEFWQASHRPVEGWRHGKH